MHRNERYPPRVRRCGAVLFAVAVSLIVAGMGLGHGPVLAVGLVLAPFGLHLVTGGPEPRRRTVRILPNHAAPSTMDGHREWVLPPMPPRPATDTLEAGTGTGCRTRVSAPVPGRAAGRPRANPPASPDRPPTRPGPVGRGGRRNPSSRSGGSGAPPVRLR
ncbi:hypothetical protein GCM10009557_69170 [Virgisporangium ochraceum]|uniref:Uncharacterized protein n=1 Tax=Virgisporangium ochraceum TaxID=65505 RepID=A0A8J3ZYM5_9ACTN|nr:hypothetical protein [Virgisporangium ochraceum]GIJ72554.1 hypothetical protein Voc01_074710 [Virgisporangium ochraceum]